MVILGLTGSIGMGKTTAMKAFERLGAMVWDADAAVHRALGPGGAAVGAVGQAFPGVVVKGPGGAHVDRAKLGGMVFSDAAALRRLEAILHPIVRAEERKFLMEAQQRRCGLVVLDIPLLFETGGERRCDATVVVSAPAFVQRARVLGRPGMNKTKLAGILERQMPDEEKRRRAEFVVPTGLDRRVSLRAVHRVARCLERRRGRHWPKCWPVATDMTAERAET